MTAPDLSDPMMRSRRPPRRSRCSSRPGRREVPALAGLTTMNAPRLSSSRPRPWAAPSPAGGGQHGGGRGGGLARRPGGGARADRGRSQHPRLGRAVRGRGWCCVGTRGFTVATAPHGGQCTVTTSPASRPEHLPRRGPPRRRQHLPPAHGGAETKTGTGPVATPPTSAPVLVEAAADTRRDAVRDTVERGLAGWRRSPDPRDRGHHPGAERRRLRLGGLSRTSGAG
ncbi:hypothetical protein QJS66_20010 [Kocuria rhizophila]|nr:hypothetical protein QJS66_20010 [Kocuria rhizophila]